MEGSTRTARRNASRRLPPCPYQATYLPFTAPASNPVQRRDETGVKWWSELTTSGLRLARRKGREEGERDRGRDRARAPAHGSRAAPRHSLIHYSAPVPTPNRRPRKDLGPHVSDTGSYGIRFGTLRGVRLLQPCLARRYMGEPAVGPTGWTACQ